MEQVISLGGSVIILTAFIGNLFGKIPASGLPYVVLNVVGSAILSTIAILEEQWGFLLLEGVWTIVSLYGLVRLLRRGENGASGQEAVGVGH